MSAKFFEIFKVLVVLLPLNFCAQLNEDFSDGDFTSNPIWNGQDSLFRVNGSGELQLNDTANMDNKSYLVTEIGILDFSSTITWEFRMNLLFSPSSSNQGRFYLTSDNENLKGSLNGYYISIGESGSSDNIKLYRQDGTSENHITDLTFATGAYGDNPNVRIRVTRDPGANWLIEADSLGGTNFYNEGSASDATHTFSKYFGVMAKYTSSRDTSFIFDDINISGNVIIDNDAPLVLTANVSGPNLIEITYNEAVTSSAEDISNYLLPAQGSPLLVTNNSDVYELMFNDPFLAGETLFLEVSDVEDLSSNILNDTISIVVPDTAKAGEVIINEILFDPFTGGSDYLELYNNSNKTIDLYNYLIADYDFGIANFKSIDKHFELAPAGYVLLTEDSLSTASEYIQRDATVFIEMDLPTYPNDSATVYVLNPDSLVLDFFSYDQDMHFDLINNSEGVSLERISLNSPTNDQSNWHSAAESAGWGTPGLENSQNYNSAISSLFFEVETPVFSPDSDGYQDVALFSYQMEIPGYVANLVIYDKSGRVIKRVLENELLANSGTTTWDGTMSSGEKARIGIYLIYFEVFDLTGNVQVVKKTITLSGRL